ncbi:DUF5133 domain-containing protein (plasmid) [Streptomyces sp. NBC_01426]|uniref:DUF5133 domain-containing protein n=1 Tax=Streptomyces sp. NBC_01426 TaxID=2975866 RepID=UPI002E3086D0|nr:DUF5133 domain-containing protein [Streptomyces sp. NBC_01426]
MTADVLPTPRLQGPGTPPAAPLSEPARSWAVGMLMATLPGPAHLAEQVLSAAATRAGLAESEVARAMVAGSRGTPLPADIEQALDHAVQAGRRPGTGSRRAGSFLLPTREDAERALGRFFDARVRLCAAPDDPEARRAVDDAVYTLCVLMAQPSPHAAVNEALQYTNA